LNPKRPILLLLSTLIGILALSQNIEFIENKGQWDKEVLFMGKVSAGAFFIHKNGFTVLQHNATDWESLNQSSHNHGSEENKRAEARNLVLRSHAYKVDFIGADTKAQIIPDKPLMTYNNYFIGDDPSKWASDCKIYQGITIRNIYPNIDVRYYSDRGTMKYDLIVNPGGRVSDIALKYDGIDKLEIKNKELVIGTSVGQLKELSPYTYQYKEKGRAEVQSKYSIKDNTVRFNIKNYDPGTILIIDPTLIFCSLSGSSADNWGFTATYGPDGSMYGGGIVFAQGFPTSTGAFQTNYGGGASGCFGTGGFDIGIIKLSPDGTSRIYATYIGGSANEMPHSLIVDAQGELIVAGKTNSTNYPLKNGALIGDGGGWDITITKLNASGSALIGSRRIGGKNDDGANITPCGGGAQSLQQNYGDESRTEVDLDAAGNIYLASCTQSNSLQSQGGFPVQGAFQSVSGGGAQDGVLLKFSPDLSTLAFSTFLGGRGNDAAYVLAINPFDGNIYVAGGTESDNLPGSTSGTIGPSYNGGIDGFVSIVSGNGSSILKTTYLGTSGIDQVYGIQFDRFGFPYVMGQTTGAWPVLNAAWSQPNGKQFIAKLKPDLSAYAYSTTFGKGEAFPDVSPVAFLVDRCENVYVSGWGGQVDTKYKSSGVQGLPVTPDAIKSAPDINSTTHLGQDFYFFVLEKNAKAQLYGSFFGQNAPTSIGDHVDGGTSRFDQNGVIYQAICANCSNNLAYPTTPGAWATAKPSSANCNLAMVKISFDFAGVGSGVQSFINGVPRDTAGCVPLTVDFKDTAQMAVSYEWDFGDGSAQITTTAPDATHTFTAVGVYKVMLVAIDSTTCNIRDTSYLNIKVGATQALPDFNYRKADPTDCNSLLYQFDNITTAPSGFSFTNKSFTWDFGDKSPTITTGTAGVTHNYAAPGTYIVRLTLDDSTYCNSPDFIEKTIRVSALVKADFETPKAGCAPYKAVFNNISAGGSAFNWEFGDGATSTDVSPVHLYGGAGTYIIKLTAIDSATCNKIDVKVFTITVYDNPIADFAASPQPPTENKPISFTNLSTTDAVKFKWLFGDGDSLITTSRAAVEHEYNATNTYNACLIATNPAGCADTICKPVTTLIVPALDVPNAFTPLSGDVNSKIFVRGFGFAKVKFIIWARWGQKVFESNDKRNGWDGRYNGKVLPMDVYAYTLDVEFTDGTKASKKGDITLIR